MNTDFGTHLLNPTEKRLEPKATLCSFCKQSHSVAMTDNYFVPIYREQKRTNIVVYRSVNFNQVTVGIPRCAECKSVHETSAVKATLLAILLTIVLIFIAFQINIPAGVISLFLSLASILVLKPFIENKLISQKGILTKRECAEDDPMVVDFILNGWSLNRPMA